MAEWRSEHLGRVRFTRKGNPAIDKGQSTRERAQPPRDWSDFESRLRELVRLSSEVSSELTIEPHVTLAHDTRDPLATLLGQVNRGNAVTPIARASSPTPQPQAIRWPRPFQPNRPMSPASRTKERPVRFAVAPPI